MTLRQSYIGNLSPARVGWVHRGITVAGICWNKQNRIIRKETMEFLKVYLETVFVLNGKKNARKHFLKNQERIIKVSKKSVTN